MEDDNLLDDELAGPSGDLDPPATFSNKLILKFGMHHTNTGTDTINLNNNTIINTWITGFSETQKHVTASHGWVKHVSIIKYVPKPHNFYCCK